MNALPDGWIEVPIGMVCEVAGGSTPRTNVAEYWDGDIPWLTPDDLSRDRSQYVGGGRRCLTEAGYSSCSTQLIPAGSVLYTSRAPIGYVAIAKQAVCTNQGFKSFVPPPGLSSRYLYWYLQWATPMIRNLGSGTTFAEISGKVAKTVPLRLPPNAEQERIVAAIEEEVSRLDEAEQLLWSARRRADRMRCSVLATVTPTDCTWKTLGEIAEIVGGVTKDSKRQSDPSFVEVPYLRVANVQRGYLDLREVTTIRVPPEKAKALRLEPGDVLFNEGGDRDKLGRGWVWQGEIDDCIHQNHVFRVRLLTDAVDPKYISFHGNTFGQQWFEKMGKQTTNLASINLRTLKSFPVPNLPVEEQYRIVAEVELRLTILDSLSTAIDHALTRSTHLRRSILERAFTGKLVPQDPDDEPAFELLARIASDHRKTAKPPRR